jgi:hypothetical protein
MISLPQSFLNKLLWLIFNLCPLHPIMILWIISAFLVVAAHIQLLVFSGLTLEHFLGLLLDSFVVQEEEGTRTRIMISKIIMLNDINKQTTWDWECDMGRGTVLLLEHSVNKNTALRLHHKLDPRPTICTRPINKKCVKKHSTNSQTALDCTTHESDPYFLF